MRIRELFEQANDGWDGALIERLMGYLDELPTDMLEVLQLRFFEDKDFHEIAFILDISESGAKMRTYQALDRLRKNSTSRSSTMQRNKIRLRKKKVISPDNMVDRYRDYTRLVERHGAPYEDAYVVAGF